MFRYGKRYQVFSGMREWFEPKRGLRFWPSIATVRTSMADYHCWQPALLAQARFFLWEPMGHGGGVVASRICITIVFGARWFVGWPTSEIWQKGRRCDFFTRPRIIECSGNSRFKPFWPNSAVTRSVGKLGFCDQQFAQQLGVTELVGEQGYSTLERRWARPTCDVHGLWSGYQGEGGKTIIPSSAGAKISFRLVPNQDPKLVAEKFRQFIASKAPRGVKVQVVDLHGGSGVVVDPESPYIAAAQTAITAGFGRPAVLIREGGSIPIVADFVNLLGADVLLLGWGLDDDGAHSPNEKFCIEDYFRGIRASSYLWHALSEVQPVR
jgi:hypothetical protein